MTTMKLARRLERIEVRRPAALVIDAVIIGDAPIGDAPIDGKVIVIGGRNPNHDDNNASKTT